MMCMEICGDEMNGLCLASNLAIGAHIHKDSVWEMELSVHMPRIISVRLSNKGIQVAQAVHNFHVHGNQY